MEEEEMNNFEATSCPELEEDMDIIMMMTEEGAVPWQKRKKKSSRHVERLKVSGLSYAKVENVTHPIDSLYRYVLIRNTIRRCHKDKKMEVMPLFSQDINFRLRIGLDVLYHLPWTMFYP
jgi:hypothetical protein